MVECTITVTDESREKCPRCSYYSHRLYDIETDENVEREQSGVGVCGDCLTEIFLSIGAVFEIDEEVLKKL